MPPTNPRKRPAPGASPVVQPAQMQPTYTPTQMSNAEYLRWGQSENTSYPESVAPSYNMDNFGGDALSQPQYDQSVPAPSTQLARRPLNRQLVSTAQRPPYDTGDSWSGFGDDSMIDPQNPNAAMGENDNIEMLEERANVAKREAQAKRKQIPPFVQKLSSFLDDGKNTELIRWSDRGDSFVVLDEDEFAKTLIPELFKHNNYASFVRQLNMYGFHKRVGLSDNSMKASERKNKSPSEYYNPYFKRGHPNLLWLINKPKGGTSSKKGRGSRVKNEEEVDSDEDGRDVEETFGQTYTNSMQGVSRAISAAPESGPLQRREMAIVQSQLADIQKQQGTISSAIARLRKDHNQLYQQAIAFQSLHDRHENSINAILTFLATIYNRSLDGQSPQNIAQMFSNLNPQDAQRQNQGNVVDIGDLTNQQQASGSTSPHRRSQRLLMPPTSANLAKSPSPKTSYNAQNQFAESRQTSGAIEELFDTPPADHPIIKSEGIDTLPQQGMMNIINNTNAQVRAETNGMEFPEMLTRYENANGNSPLTSEQRNNMLSLMANSASTPGSNNALVSPTPPQALNLDALHYTQAEIDDLVRLQNEQDIRIGQVRRSLSPDGSIPGLDDNLYYNGTSGSDPAAASLDLDQFIDSGAYYTGSSPVTGGFNYDDFGVSGETGAIGGESHFDLGMDGIGDTREDDERPRIVETVNSSQAATPETGVNMSNGEESNGQRSPNKKHLHSSEERSSQELETFEEDVSKLDRERCKTVKAIRKAAVLVNFPIVFSYQPPITLKIGRPLGEKIISHDTTKKMRVRKQRRYVKPILKIYPPSGSKPGLAWLKKHSLLKKKTNVEKPSYLQPLKLRPTPYRSAIQGQVTKRPLRTSTQLAPCPESSTKLKYTLPTSDHLKIAGTYFFDNAMKSGISMRGGDGSFLRPFSIDESVTSLWTSTPSLILNSPASATTASTQSELCQTTTYEHDLEYVKLHRTYCVPKSVDQIYDFKANQDEYSFKISWLPNWISEDEYFFQQAAVTGIVDEGVLFSHQRYLVEWEPSTVSYHSSASVIMPLTSFSLALNSFAIHSQDTGSCVQKWLDHTPEACGDLAQISADEVVTYARNVETLDESSDSLISVESLNTQPCDEEKTVERLRPNLRITVPQRRCSSPPVDVHCKELRYISRPAYSDSGDWIAAFSRDRQKADRGRELIERQLAWRLEIGDVEDPEERDTLAGVISMFTGRARDSPCDSVNMRGGLGGPSGLLDDEDLMEPINVDENYINHLPPTTERRGSSTSPPVSLLAEPVPLDDTGYCDLLFCQSMRQNCQRIISFITCRNPGIQTEQRYDELPSIDEECCCCCRWIPLSRKIKSLFRSPPGRQSRPIHHRRLNGEVVIPEPRFPRLLTPPEESHEESGDSDSLAGRAGSDNDERNSRDGYSLFAFSEGSHEENADDGTFAGLPFAAEWTNQDESSNSVSFHNTEFTSASASDANINYESSPLIPPATRHEAYRTAELPPTLNTTSCTSIPSPVPSPVYPENDVFEDPIISKLKEWSDDRAWLVAHGDGRGYYCI
ncbi:hypothetical protein B7494_g7944 [Chlorociboria aeruginascens]|nr:hypothetical protein B7494_g7944 [Chlorociboria aeruginascens]